VLEQFVPPRHTARSATGSLAKLLAWNAERGGLTPQERLCHQADYVIRQFLGRNEAAQENYDDQNVSIVSDWHNCLKLGYDVRRLEWPLWMSECLHSVGLSTAVLPDRVVSPGTPIGPVAAWACQQFGLPASCVLTGGTTDSNAAFFAAVGSVSAPPGTAVTSLGSTLAIKQLSTAYVEDADKGVYSHRFPSVLGSKHTDVNSSSRTSSSTSRREAWLVGGASNAGCLVLRAQGFSNEELDQLSQSIDPDTDTNLSYYPLASKGERFPVADRDKEPILEPVPDSRGEFLHGILQGISDVERDGFLALGELGASPPTPSQVWTCGGGSRNDVWSKMRQRRLREAFGSDVTVARANNVEASYGAAILAAASFVTSTTSSERVKIR
jgi:xylulokinase